MAGITAANHVLGVAHHRVIRSSVSCQPIHRNKSGPGNEQGPMELLHRALILFVLLRVLEAASTAEASSTTTTAAAITIVIVVEEAEIRILSLVPVKSGSV